MPSLDKIFLKKKFGQHFLTEKWVVEHAIDNVELDENTSVLEIGGGAGFLTESILERTIKRLWLFEIDTDWVKYLRKKFDPSINGGVLQVFDQDFLEVDFAKLEAHKPWTVLANLPYNVSFPILHSFIKNRHLFKEGVVMVQEEVAQKIVKTHGRGYGAVSLLFQHYFNWKLLDKIPPTAFNPPPKIFSRLLYFKPIEEVQLIPNEEKFWKFVKLCFKLPRRTLRNNLAQTHFNWQQLDDNTLKLRAQQMVFEDFVKIWNILK